MADELEGAVAEAPDSNQAEISDANVTTDQSQEVVTTSAEQTATETDSQTESQLPDWAQKGWGRVNPLIAELTGKTPDEISKLSLADRVNLAQTTYSEKLEKLAELEAQGDFVGIKVDAPAEQWNVKEQLDNLPAAFQNKLIGSVFSEHLPQFVEESLANPQENPEEFQLLDQAAAVIAQRTFGRPLQEIKAIFDLTRDLTPDQVYQLVSGTGQGYQPNNGVPQSGVAPQLPLAQQAIAQGYQPDDPYVQQLRARDIEYGQLQSQIKTMQQTVNDLSQYREKETQTAQERAIAEAHGAVDKQAETARKGALEASTKGRVPEDKLSNVSRWISRDADAEIAADAKCKQYLSLAKEWQKDGLEGKAQGQLALYAARVQNIYKRVSGEMLGELVVQNGALRKADAQKAARKELGGNATPAGMSNVTPPNVSAKDDPGEYALNLYRQSQGA